MSHSPGPSKNKKWTVVLMYPDYMADDWPYSLYSDHVLANSRDEAVSQTQALVHELNKNGDDYEANSPDDFAPILALAGWHKIQKLC
jgi:hypothetical protein